MAHHCSKVRCTGIEVDHVTIYRRVQRFTPLLIDSARPCRHAAGDRWFADETDVKVAGRRWVYLYRSINQYGQVMDVLVSEQRVCGIEHVLPSANATDPHDGKFTSIFDAVSASEGIHMLRAPGAGSPSKRDRRTMDRHCSPRTALDQTLIISRRHLVAVLTEDMAHFNSDMDDLLGIQTTGKDDLVTLGRFGERQQSSKAETSAARSALSLPPYSGPHAGGVVVWLRYGSRWGPMAAVVTAVVTPAQARGPRGVQPK